MWGTWSATPMATANRDAATECLDVARRALAAGDAAKAEKFAAKAMRLFPHDEVRGARGT